MMKYKLHIFLVIIALNQICSSFKPIGDNKLASIINSTAFISHFKICERDSDTIKIYYNLKESVKYQPFKIDCGKTALIEKSNILIDVNSSNLDRDRKIVLYNIEKIKSNYHYSFIDLNSNFSLTLAINKQNKISIIRKGSF
nr:hypothetical protein [uncultured Flavobacterium sp.]